MSDIRSSTSVAVPFVPHWLRDEPNPPTFMLRAGSVIERELLEAELAGEYRAGRVWPFEVAEELCNAFRAIAAEDAEELAELAQRELAHATLGGEALSAAEQATLDSCRQLAIEHWPDYAALVAQMQRRETLLPVLAFRRFCTGWQNVGAEFKRSAGFVADASMRALKPLHIRGAGIEAYNLLYLDESAEKTPRRPYRRAIPRRFPVRTLRRGRMDNRRGYLGGESGDHHPARRSLRRAAVADRTTGAGAVRRRAHHDLPRWRCRATGGPDGRDQLSGAIGA